MPDSNPYGQDIYDAGVAWFAVEPLDSDGDGRTNGEEIRDDCSLPGDAASATAAASWSLIKRFYSK